MKSSRRVSPYLTLLSSSPAFSPFLLNLTVTSNRLSSSEIEGNARLIRLFYYCSRIIRRYSIPLHLGNAETSVAGTSVREAFNYSKQRGVRVYISRNEIESISRDVIANADMISRKWSGEAHRGPKMAQPTYTHTHTYNTSNSCARVEKEEARERERERHGRKKAFANRERHDRDRISGWDSE